MQKLRFYALFILALTEALKSHLYYVIVEKPHEYQTVNRSGALTLIANPNLAPNSNV